MAHHAPCLIDMATPAGENLWGDAQPTRTHAIVQTPRMSTALRKLKAQQRHPINAAGGRPATSDSLSRKPGHHRPVSAQQVRHVARVWLLLETYLLRCRAASLLDATSKIISVTAARKAWHVVPAVSTGRPLCKQIRAPSQQVRPCLERHPLTPSI
jgi:hypothetical protein